MCLPSCAVHTVLVNLMLYAPPVDWPQSKEDASRKREMNPRRKQEPKRTRGGCSTSIRIKWKRQKDRGGTARMRQYQEHQSVVQIFMPLTHSHNSPLCDENQYSRSSKCIQKRTCEWKAAPLTNKNTQKKTNAKKQFPLHGRRLNQN